MALPGLTTSAIDLGSPAPYLIAESHDALFVAHTFMNPAFRDMSEYRYVSRYDLTTGAVASLDVGGRLLSLGVSGQTLYVLTGDGAEVTGTTYDTATMRPTSSVVVPPPAGSGYFYPAGLVVR